MSVVSLACHHVVVSGTEAVNDCEACALTQGRIPLPGGLIHERSGWLVEHCVGPLGLGALIVKPQRHITAVGDLTDTEAEALGPVIRDASQVASQLVAAEQTYNCLWSHAGGEPVHIHYVIQPVTREQMELHQAHGPRLQTAMFAAGDRPDDDDILAVCDRARILFDEIAVPGNQ